MWRHAQFMVASVENNKLGPEENVPPDLKLRGSALDAAKTTCPPSVK